MSKKVLIIENEIFVREALYDILESAGINAISVSNGKEGLATFEANREKIGAVVLDLGLPGGSGLAVFEALQAIDPAVKIIISTGYDEREVKRQFQDNMPALILTKPYNAQSFLEAVRQVWQGS